MLGEPLVGSGTYADPTINWAHTKLDPGHSQAQTQLS